jgi:hypothetical protein
VITASRLTAAQWSARVDAMLAKGARVEDDEIDVLIDYLATHFGQSYVFEPIRYAGTPPMITAIARPITPYCLRKATNSLIIKTSFFHLRPCFRSSQLMRS